MPHFNLPNRSLIRISGVDAAHFLHNLVTADIEGLSEGDLAAGALLAPQGKILFDFLVSRDAEGFQLDCRREFAAEFVRRLKFYRLRAKAEIDLQEQAEAAIALDNDSRFGWLTDRRFSAAQPVKRAYGIAGADDLAAYDRLRIERGVAEGVSDYDFGEMFPHDVNLDQIGGVSFAKGCYVGQEVVSRMQHRGTARRRVLIASAGAPLEPRAAVSWQGKPMGALGAAVGGKALALVRIDQAKDAMNAGTPIMAGGLPVTLSLPPGARFDWPQSAGPQE